MLNGQDREHLEQMLSQEQALGEYETITFETDDNLPGGSCQLLTDHGRIDAQLETQLNRIADELLIGGKESETNLLSPNEQTPENQD